MRGSNKGTHRYRKDQEDRYVAVVEMNTLDAADTITFDGISIDVDGDTSKKYTYGWHQHGCF